MTEIRATTAATSARTDCMWRSEPGTSKPLGRPRSKATRRAGALEMNPARTEIHEAAFLLMTFPAGVRTIALRSIDGIDFTKLSLFSTNADVDTEADRPRWFRSRIAADAYVDLTLIAHAKMFCACRKHRKASVSQGCIIFLYLKARDEMPFPIDCFTIGRRDAVHPSSNLQPANAVMQGTRRL